MIVITTERLFIREAQLEDATFFLELLNSPGWLEFIGDRGLNTLEEATKYLQDKVIPDYKTLGFGMFVMVDKSTNKPIGNCGLIQRDYLDHIDIGFAILPEYTKKGYSYEANSAVMEFAKKELGKTTILGITTEKNTASINLLTKLGLLFSHKMMAPNDKEELFIYRWSHIL